MSMGLSAFDLLLTVLDQIPREAETKILTLGTQDFTFTYEDAAIFLKNRRQTFIEIPPDERRTTNSFSFVSHEDWWKYKNFIHQETLFRMLGFAVEQVQSLDVDDYEHSDIIHDLNQPIPAGLGPYDLIINQGTMEHVFDVRQFLWNLSDLTKIGGRVLHLVPAGFLNHGLYNFNITLFHDFYGQAGWKTEELFYHLTPYVQLERHDTYGRVEPEKLEFIPEGFYLNIVGWFLKTEASRNCIAVQGLYVRLHDAWDHQSREQSSWERPSNSYRKPWQNWIYSRLNAYRLRRRLRKFGARIIDVRTN